MGVRDRLHFWGLALLILPGVLGDNWGVWTPKTPICTVRGSTVVIPCNYSYPNKSMKVENVIWCKPEKCSDYHVDNGSANDVTSQFKGRAMYLGDKKNNCTLKIKDLRYEDSGSYWFRFESQDKNKWTGVPEVKIEVTGLRVNITSSRGNKPIMEGDNVTLTCAANNSCNLNQSDFTLLKNKQLTQGLPSPHTFKSISNQSSGNYSCALKDNRTISFEEIILDVQYPPRETSVSVSPREAEEGSSVTLTCSSDANPRVQDYTWFKNNITVPSENAMTYTISNICSRDSGQYHCMVRNEHGAHNSTAVSLSPAVKPSSQFLIALAVGIVLTVLAVALATIIYFKRRKAEGQTEDPGSAKGVQAADNARTRELRPPGPPSPALSSQEGEDGYASVHFTKKQPKRRNAEGQTEDPGCAKGVQAADNARTRELRPPGPPSLALSSQEEEVCYAAVHFTKKQPKRSAQRLEQPEDDGSIYSALRH
ncbi:B-cell receptor CD22-like isoform X3 [Anguilla anguilla]|uniref:B-cell receptor CD22-like isoform X3 n=1 Tax=Anguilla anguilla TaxID=7936 RepID=UPI0015B0204D|nr:B-cell receptor CD22-like isoform X3 [Anguilla anguilla]